MQHESVQFSVRFCPVSTRIGTHEVPYAPCGAILERDGPDTWASLGARQDGRWVVLRGWGDLASQGVTCVRSAGLMDHHLPVLLLTVRG